MAAAGATSLREAGVDASAQAVRSTSNWSPIPDLADEIEADTMPTAPAGDLAL